MCVCGGGGSIKFLIPAYPYLGVHIVYMYMSSKGTIYTPVVIYSMLNRLRAL